MKRIQTVVAVLALGTFACETQGTSDTIQQHQSEQILAEATAAVGMPAVTNFTERRLTKRIIELRDQADLLTYTYVWPEHSPGPIFFCESLGYGLPYTTQFTNPQKIADSGRNYGYAILPQADPNGLFSPTSSSATWVMCLHDGEAKPTYVEPLIVVSQFRLDAAADR